MDSKLIGIRIKESRQELKLTLQDVANDIGVAKSTILRYENGTIENIKLPVIEAIARVLKVSPSYLLGKTDIKNASPLKKEDANLKFDEAIKIFEHLTPEQYQLVLERAKAFAELNARQD